MLVLLAMTLGGCFKADYGIALNNDGTGYVYSKAVVSEEFEGDLNSSSENIFTFGDAKTIKRSVTEYHDAVKFEGEMYVQEFSSLDELVKLTGPGFSISRKNGEVTVRVKGEENSDLMSQDGLSPEELVKALEVAGVESKFKFHVNGKILKTNGKVDKEKNIVSWDMLDFASSDNKEIYLVYKEEKGAKNRTIESDKIISTKVAEKEREKQGEIKVNINGREVIFHDQKPIIKNGTTLVPIRVISENLGADVEWIPDNFVEIKKGAKTIGITIGRPFITTLNESTGKGVTQNIKIGTPAEIIGGRTMIPLRAVAEVFDMEVNWDKDTKTAIIVTD